MAIELTTVPTETVVDVASDFLWMNDVSETPDAINKITPATLLGTDLTAIRALTSAANKLPYATGAGTWALTDLSAFGRSLIDDADAATGRTTLGAVGLTGNETIAGDKTFSGAIIGTSINLSATLVTASAAVHSQIQSEDVTLGQAAKSFFYLRDNEANELHVWPNELRMDAIRTRIGDWQLNSASNYLDIDSNGAGTPYVHILSGGAPVVIGDIGAVGNGTTLTIDDAGQAIIITAAITFPDNIRQTFNPGATNAGLNVGAIAGDPSAPSNGDLWYDSTANELTARINGANVALGAGGGGSIDGSGSSNAITIWSDADTLAAAAGLTKETDEVLRLTMQSATEAFVIREHASQTAGPFRIEANDGTDKIWTVRDGGGYRVLFSGSASYIGFGDVQFGQVDGLGVNAIIQCNNGGAIKLRDNAGATNLQVDSNATAGNTRMLVYDVDNATLERVSVGAADSGGSGYKVLRIPN